MDKKTQLDDMETAQAAGAGWSEFWSEFWQRVTSGSEFERNSLRLR